MPVVQRVEDESAATRKTDRVPVRRVPLDATAGPDDLIEATLAVEQKVEPSTESTGSSRGLP
jgi:hypothetical protein